ncbi:MAG: bifunctional phosphopantothenoylcysteine decarboxylase/phosphopantothenate--cysteine ligase CoaBC [Acidimicrobiales bacterium]
MSDALRGGGTAEESPCVVLGVCGGIAAYKAVEVCRRLVDAGAHVVPVLTDDATRFVGPVTFSALASEPAQTSLWDADDPVPHVRLGRRADVVVVAPATARLLGSYAAGISSDLLTATLLATGAPVVVCPSMHNEMWEHPAVGHNLDVLRRRGVHVVEPAVGRLAGGDEGPGRLADPADIVAAVHAVLGGDVDGRTPDSGSSGPGLAGCRVLVTAGGTREPIDAVRFLGNRSSGKQGHAVAAEAVARGALVTLVTASDRPAPAGVDVVAVETAADMERAVVARAPDADVVVMAAAVADFRPRPAPRSGGRSGHSAPRSGGRSGDSVATKLDKADGMPELVLEPTVDILAGLGRSRRPGQVLVGFAAETGDVAARAGAKLEAKGLDVVVGNDVSAPDAGFDADTNRAVIVEADGTTTAVPLVDKRELASILLDIVTRHLDRATTTPTPDPTTPTPNRPTLNGRHPDDPTGLRGSTHRSTP